VAVNVGKSLLKAKSLIKKGDVDTAAQLYKLILASYPQNRQAINGLASLAQAGSTRTQSGGQPSREQIENLLRLYNAGNLQLVLERGEILATQYPDDPILYNLIGVANAGLGNPEIAIGSFSKAIKLKPDYAEVYSNLGAVFKDLGRYKEAISSFANAIKLAPTDADSYYNLGNLFKDACAYEKAAASYRKAIQHRADYAWAHNNLGTVLRELGRREEAVVSYTKAVSLKPDYAQAHNNLGNVLNEIGRYEDAAVSHASAIQLQPDLAEAHSNLGNDLKSLGRLDEAIASYGVALQYKPDFEDARVRMLHQQACICDWKAIRSGAASIADLGVSKNEVVPFSMLSLEDHPARHLKRSQLYAEKMFQIPDMPVFARPDVKPERLRIGYFSADFHNHAIMFLMVKLFELHDSEKFVIHAYSYGVDSNDGMRNRLLAAVDVFHDVSDLSDRDVAKLCRSEGIDIAVDLTGYTQDSRSGIFGFRPAPVQINYLGYPGSMGAPFIDYILADELVIPAEQRKHYSEEIIYLPHSYQVNDSAREISDEPVSRAAEGLPETGFVFCCFNNNYKISSREFDIWMRLLLQVEGSVLWLLKPNQLAKQNLRREAKNRGVDPERIIFAHKAQQADHLARHRLADLFLDTFNYNAHTTASDALWAGLPVITKMGESFSARVAGSLLNAIGVPELITCSEASYEQLSLELALKPQKLAALKEKLAANRLTTALFDTGKFAEHIEDAYQLVYQRYIDGKVPETIFVKG